MMLRIQTRTLVLMLILLAAVVWADSIEFVPGSGREVSSETNLTRDRDFFYHNNTDDQQWYGTHKWAVRFDFSDVYPTYSTSSFILKKVKAFFPITPNPITDVSVSIHSDSLTYPGIEIATTTIDSVSDWIVFALNEPITLNSCWIVVTCSTTVAGPYISASAGGGLHSYYWNTNQPVAYFQNLFTAGIFSEFLFSAIGRFDLSSIDLELYSFELKPDITVGRTVYPEFTIYNNSDSLITSPSIIMTITSPNPEFALQDTIVITRSIAPNSTFFVSYDNPDYGEYAFDLPDFPTQFKARAVLHSEFDVADTLFNNTLSRYYNAFSQEIPFKVVENFIREDQSQNFLLAQDVINTDEIRPINYFPVITDPYYQVGAVQRFNWYGFSGQPMTTIGGDRYITGFLPGSYEDHYNDAIDELNLQKTFLTQNDASLNLPSPYTTIQVRVTLRNPETFVFSDNIEPSIVRQSRFYAALCKKVNLFDGERYAFDRWAAYQDTIATAISLGNTWLKQFSFSVSDIGLDSLLTDYDIIYWIQHNTSKQIFFSGVLSLSQIVSNDDDTLPVIPVKIVLSPNPVKAGGNLNLNITGTDSKAVVSYKIYNIRGQLVSMGTPENIKGQNIIPTTDISSAGVYIIRFVIRNNSKPDRTLSQTRKIIIY